MRGRFIVVHLFRGVRHASGTAGGLTLQALDASTCRLNSTSVVFSGRIYKGGGETTADSVIGEIEDLAISDVKKLGRDGRGRLRGLDILLQGRRKVCCHSHIRARDKGLVLGRGGGNKSVLGFLFVVDAVLS